MTDPIDIQLIQNFLDGDIDAFNRLAGRWQTRLYRFSFRYVGNDDDAKEIVQLSLIKAYKYLKGLKNPDRFSSWIYQIAVNLCKDHLKSSNRNKFVPLEANEGEDGNRKNGMSVLDYLDGGEDTAAEVNSKNIGEIVKNTIARLPEEQRIIIIMKEYQGLKFREIAEILEVPVNTVKSRMYYGLQQMHKILKGLKIDKEVLYDEM